MEYNENTPSCLMLAAELITPVSLGSIFETEDLVGDGICFDSHITVLFSHTYLNRFKVIEEMENIPGLMSLNFFESLNSIENNSVFNLFNLGSFDNESGYIVLKLKDNTEQFNELSLVNKKLSEAFKIKSDFGTYKPHMTLAEIKPDKIEKYLNSDSLRLVLQNSKVRFEDFVFSYSIGDGKYKTYDLTHFNSVDRFFRVDNLKRENLE